MTTLYHYDNRLVGFGSNITVAFSTIKYCIKNNLKCHINTENIMYGGLEQNLWNLYLEQPFSIEIDSKEYKNVVKTDCFKLGCWEYPNMDIALKKLRNKEHIAEFQQIYKKYFIIKQELREIVDKFFENFNNKKILGFHRRGRDQLSSRGHGKNQKQKLDLPYLYSVVDSEIDEYDLLFLTSDEGYVYKEFQKRYGSKLIFLDPKQQIEHYDHGLHELFINQDIFLKNNMLKIMMLEMIILSKSDRLLLVNSNLSQIALFLSNHLNYKFYDEHIFYT